MKDFIFITGNQHKADYLAKWLGHPVPHRRIDLDEIQSLDPHQVVEHKVHQAYAIAKQPVLVEDISLTFTAMGRLPGTLVKWFLEEIKLEGLCKIADGLEHRGARAGILYALYDGHKIHYFDATVEGQVADKPKGENGFGWDPIFVPNGHRKTYAEMTEEERYPVNVRGHAIEKLRTFLDQS